MKHGLKGAWEGFAFYTPPHDVVMYYYTLQKVVWPSLNGLQIITLKDIVQQI